MDASRAVVSRFDLAANQVWLWGQGSQPTMPSFASRYGLDAALNSAVDLVRGLGVLTDIEVVDVEGMTAGYDTDYAAQRECALDALADGADLFLIHIEATDEAGHAGDVHEKIRALESWDRDVLGALVARARPARPVATAACCPTTPRRCGSRPTPPTRCPTSSSTRRSTAPAAPSPRSGWRARRSSPATS